MSKKVVVFVEHGIEWGGRRRRGPTEAEFLFAEILHEANCDIQFWLYEDTDASPWMIASLDMLEGNTVQSTLRLDFDERGIRGGWSHGDLNWDAGVRAEDARVDYADPDGICVPNDGRQVSDLAGLAKDWFQQHAVEL